MFSARFSVAEKQYRPIAVLRWSMVLIFISFGIQKFTPMAAESIVPLITHSPLVWWLNPVFGDRGEAFFLGAFELSTALLLSLGAFIPLCSFIGALMGTGTFAITWSFFFTTPGVVKWRLSTDPIAWNLRGEFLFKDIALLAICVVLLLASWRSAPNT